MPKKFPLPVIACLVLAHVAWGINTPAIKIAVESISVPLFLTVRYVFIVFILLPFAIKYWQPIKFQDLLRQALVAGCFALEVFLIGIALTKTTSINTAAIEMFNPLIMLLLAALFLKGTINKRALLGVMIAFGGSLILVGHTWESGDRGAELFGALLVFIAVTAGVVGVILQKPLAEKYNPFQINLLGLSIGIIPSVVYVLANIEHTDFGAITERSLFGLLLSAISILAANILFFYALSVRKITQISFYYYIQPAVVILAAWFLLSERPTLSYWFGLLLIGIGVFIAEKYTSQKVSAKAKLRKRQIILKGRTAQ